MQGNSPLGLGTQTVAANASAPDLLLYMALKCNQVLRWRHVRQFAVP